MLPEPIIKQYKRFFVVRDDLIAGGTKSRYLQYLFEIHDEIVYATPACGGAQLALAYCARKAGKKLTLFVAKRKEPHPRTLEAKKAGARVFQVPHGYLNNVQSKAKQYAKDHNAYYLVFGGYMEETINEIARSAAIVQEKVGEIDEVWCASGSGTLITGLKKGIEAKSYHAVQVGAELKNLNGVNIHKYSKPFMTETKAKPPFPSCPNYDAKAWELCTKRAKGSKILFWNVLGPSPTKFSFQLLPSL